LPDPFGPTSATRSRAPIRNEASRNRSRAPKDFRIPDSVITTGERNPRVPFARDVRERSLRSVSLERFVERVAAVEVIEAAPKIEDLGSVRRQVSYEPLVVSLRARR
jgi:hypothetical protein